MAFYYDSDGGGYYYDNDDSSEESSDGHLMHVGMGAILNLQALLRNRQGHDGDGSSDNSESAEDAAQIAEVPAVVTEALSNELVVKTIFKFTSGCDLLSCRLVNKNWKNFANQVLKTRTAAPLTITVDGKTDFDELMHCIMDCDGGENQWPFRGLKVIFGTSDWSYHPEKWARLIFFRLYSHLFKRQFLKCSVGDEARAMNGIRDLLCGPMQLVDEIEIHEFHLESGAGVFTLDSVRTIKFSEGYRLEKVKADALKSLLANCPNLREIRGIHIMTMPGVVSSGKAGLVTHMSYCKCRPYRDERDVNLVEYNPSNLTRLMLVCKTSNYSRCQSVEFGRVKEILEANSDTVCAIEARFQLTPAHPEWPFLPNLTDLLISQPNCFPRDVSFQFPSLSRVVLATSDLKDEAEFCKYLWTEAVPTVETLELQTHVCRANMGFLAKIFPNVSLIKMDCSSYEPQNIAVQMWDIWSLKHFGSLKNLEIVGVPVKLMAKADFSLDAFMTGFPHFIVKKIRAKPEMLKEPLIREFRENEGISSLKGLRELSITFDYDKDLKIGDFPEDKPFVSELMFQAGIDALPDLHTKFYYDFSCGNLKVMQAHLRFAAGKIPSYHRCEKKQKN